jgi:hypothetical protein
MWSWTLLVGCRKSIHTVPQGLRASSFLNSYTSGVSRMDSNNLYEEKRNTEASGCVWQNCWMPKWSAEFQSRNRVDDTSSFCWGTKLDRTRNRKRSVIGVNADWLTPCLPDCDVWGAHLWKGSFERQHWRVHPVYWEGPVQIHSGLDCIYLSRKLMQNSTRKKKEWDLRAVIDANPCNWREILLGVSYQIYKIKILLKRVFVACHGTELSFTKDGIKKDSTWERTPEMVAPPLA